MFCNNDNWEEHVAATRKKEQLCQPFHAQSTNSPSITSDFSFSFNLSSSNDDMLLSLSSPQWSASNQKKDDCGTKTAKVTPSSIPVEDQDPVENLPHHKNFIFTPIRHYGAFSPIGTPEISRKIISPKKTSPTLSSRVHPRTGGKRSDSSEKENYPLPLPPEAISNSSPSSRSNSFVLSRSLERFQSPALWKKGGFLGRGAFGNVFIGFNSEKGQMCAIKEVALSFYDAKSKQSVNMFGKEVALVSSLKHPNIVQSYGSETVGDNFCIFFEYVPGGPIDKILKEYGQLGESAIRNYTQQILTALVYLHSKSIAHRDIKSENVLIDPNGIVKLFKFGIGNHIAGKSREALLVDTSPYWMAPEVIMNPNARNLAVDIWSLGCTILEMATSKPPNSQYDGAIAMLKVARHKEVPSIPNHLSDECKDFLRHCLQWDPRRRPTAAQLLEHPFVNSRSPLARNLHSRDIYSQTKIPARVSPVGLPRPHPRSPSINSPSYWDPKILRGVFSEFHKFQEPTPSDHDAVQKQFGKFVMDKFINN